MTINLVAGRLEQGIALRGIGGGDVLGGYHPDADAFLTPRIEIARMLDGHARIGGMQAADVLMIETAARPDEDLVQRPLVSLFHRRAHAITPKRRGLRFVGAASRHRRSRRRAPTRRP